MVVEARQQVVVVDSKIGGHPLSELVVRHSPLAYDRLAVVEALVAACPLAVASVVCPLGEVAYCYSWEFYGYYFAGG